MQWRIQGGVGGGSNPASDSNNQKFATSVRCQEAKRLSALGVFTPPP